MSAIGVFGKRWCTRIPEDKHRRRHDRGRGARRHRSRRRSAYGRDALGLPPERCYTDAARAPSRTTGRFLHRRGARPQHHEGVIDLAIAHGLDILCEKPIADTMEASIRIARKIGAAGRKMAVTMSHRFDQDKTTLRQIVRSGMLGKINAIGCRFQGDMRQHMAWSSLFRHHDARPVADRGRDPSPGHHRRSGRRALRHALRHDVEAELGRICGRHRRHRHHDCSRTACAPSMRARSRTRSDSTPSTRNTSASTASTARRSSTTAMSRLFMRQDIWRQQHREGQGQKIALLAQPKWINHWLIEQFATVARRRSADGDAGRGKSAGVRAGVRRDREPAQRRAGQGAGLHRGYRARRSRRPDRHSRSQSMEIRNVGRSGLRVSLVGLGCNNFGGRIDLDATRRVVHRALDVGITLFDTADSYGNRGGSETLLGEIARRPAQGHRARDQVRQPMDEPRRMKGASRRYIMSAVEASLQPAEDRLDRSLPAASAGSADADRGDAARARRSRRGRARSATSAAPTSPPGRSPMRHGRRARTISAPFASARTSTACWRATPSASCCRR